MLMKQKADCFQVFWLGGGGAQGRKCVKAPVVKVAPPCERMAGVECGCGLGPGPAAQKELLLLRNPGELRCGRGNRAPGSPGDGETAVCCFLHLLKPELLPSVNAPAVWICAEHSLGWSEGGLCCCCLVLATEVCFASLCSVASTT